MLHATRALGGSTGVCAALALLDAPPTTKLPPLECLFTVDEVSPPRQPP